MVYKQGYYDMFVRTCARWPANVAVRQKSDTGYDTYTYSELYGVCEYISQNLQQLHCTRGIIGLVSSRNLIIPCVIAAAHKCSTAFMFLEPSKDINNIVNSMQFKTIIVIGNENQEFEETYRKADRIITIFNIKISFYVIENLDSSSLHLAEHSFIAMTSGSTGDPKQIQVPIQCIEPNINDLTKLFKISQDDVIYFSTPLTFDPSMIEILLACENGASLLIAPEQADILFPSNKDNAVTFWQTTPSRFFQFPYSVISNRILSSKSSLKVLAFGGEPLNGVKRLRELKSKENKTKIYTLYGVTEMSCWACLAELNLEKHLNDNDIPLGNCLSETEIELKPSQEDNTLGNIILLSKTRKCVVLNKVQRPSEGSAGMNYVDTGDLGEMKNGIIYYRGRRDDIIKRFGHKVNMQAIERVVMHCPKINSCSCIWLPKPSLLIVYYSSEMIDSQELIDFLKIKLDHISLPDRVIKVKSLPINEHGKVSKKILMKLYESSNMSTVSRENFRSKFLRELRSSLNLTCPYNEIKDKDFFSLGGTSILAVTLCNKLCQYYPELARLVLPHLLSHKNTIGTVLRIVRKVEFVNTNANRLMLKTKRSGLSIDESVSETELPKRSNSEINVKIALTEMWSYDTKKCVDATPALFESNGIMFVTVGSHSGKIVSLEALNGIIRGIMPMSCRIEASVFCFYDVNKVAYGVVGTYDGTVLCYLLENCSTVWQINVGAMIKSKAVCYNGHLYVASYDGNIRCINNKNGQISKVIKITTEPISADLAQAKDFVLTGTLSGVCAGINSKHNSVAWRDTLGSPVFAKPVVYDNNKYVVYAEVNGTVHCRTVEKGLKIWKFDGAKGNVFSSLHFENKDNGQWQMTFGCHDHKVYCVNINNHQTELAWTFNMYAPVYATPSLLENYVISICTKGRLVFINSENGTLVYEYTFPGEIFSSPIVYKDYIFVGCRNDKLYAMKYKVI